MMRAILLSLLIILAAPALAEQASPSAPVIEIPDHSLLLTDLITGKPTVIKNPSKITVEEGKRYIPQDKQTQSFYLKLTKEGREPLMAIIDATKDFLERTKAKSSVDAKTAVTPDAP